jgi:hypothetical protein
MDNIPVYHKKCQGIAFYTTRRWKVGDPLKASEAILSFGERPKAGDMIFCGSCGEKISFFNTEISYNAK